MIAEGREKASSPLLSFMLMDFLEDAEEVMEAGLPEERTRWYSFFARDSFGTGWMVRYLRLKTEAGEG